MLGRGADTGWTGPVGVVDQPRTRLEGTLSLLEHDEERTAVSLYLVDVTEPLELQERLQAERDYTRSVIDIASSMIIVTDVDGVVIAANPATIEMTGFTEEELAGRPFWESLLAEDQRADAAALFGDPSQLPLTGEAQLLTKDDGLRVVVFSADVYQANPDAPISFVHLGERHHRGARERRDGRAPAAVGAHDRVRRHRPARPDHAVQHRRRAHAGHRRGVGDRPRPGRVHRGRGPRPASPRSAGRVAFDAIVAARRRRADARDPRLDLAAGRAGHR